MTSKRKSRRSKKSVNYTDSNSNYESDDDFEAEFETRSKKVKAKEVTNKSAIKQERTERKKPVQRLSVDEKLYQREIEKALKISLSDSSTNNEEQNSAGKARTKRLPNEEDIDYEPEQGTVCESEDDDSCDENDDSDFSENEVRRKTISKKKKANKNKSSEENIESAVSGKKPPGASIMKETEKVLSPPTPPLQMSKVIPAKQNNTEAAMKPSTKSPSVNRNLSSLGLGGVVIKNPGPPLRVGLSRNMKVKPLHSKVSISN